MTPNSGFLKVPLSFGGKSGEDAVLFMQDFEEYAQAVGFTEPLRKIGLRQSLKGEAQVWVDTQDRAMGFAELKESLLRRFKPLQGATGCILELAGASRSDSESWKGFLDRLQMIGRRGGVGTEVVVAMALKVLPTDLPARLGGRPRK
ncbi:hypothetical protein PAPHI01_2598 [Pancytospora philotis]|nr:hypothetical protein PAPHI01_2598 [Pancytospora philotis]